MNGGLPAAWPVCLASERCNHTHTHTFTKTQVLCMVRGLPSASCCVSRGQSLRTGLTMLQQPVRTMILKPEQITLLVERLNGSEKAWTGGKAWEKPVEPQSTWRIWDKPKVQRTCFWSAFTCKWTNNSLQIIGGARDASQQSMKYLDKVATRQSKEVALVEHHKPGIHHWKLKGVEHWMRK